MTPAFCVLQASRFLSYLLAVYEAVLLNFEVEFSDELFVNSVLGPSIVVEFYLEGFEKLDDKFVVLVSQLARRYSELDCFDLDRRAVLVASTYHDHVFALQSKVTCENVSGQ